MKLKAMHTYQYVRFQNKNENFLCADKNDMADLELELLPEGIVRVRSSKDEILVFPTNIAYCVPLTESTKKCDMRSRGDIAENTPSSPKR